MAAVKMKPKEKKPGTPPGERSLRNAAEKQIARTPKRSPELTKQTAEALIHDLQVHQIELEIQAEELRKSKLALEESRDKYLDQQEGIPVLSWRELALEESRDKYLDLYDFAPLGYLTLSDKTLITDVNLSGATLLGIERSKLLKAPFSKFVAEKDGDEWHWYFLNVLKQEEKQCCTLLLKRGDGSTFPARLESIRITGKSDALPMVKVAISDITDIRLAEEKLKESENFLSNIVEQIPDMIFVKDAQDLRFVRLNKAGEDLLGYSRTEMLGKNDYDLFPNDEAVFFTGNDRQVLLTNRLSDNPEEKISTRYKGERILHTKKIPIVDEKGVPQFLLGISEDITDRKRGEDALRETKDYLWNLIRYANVPIISWNPELTITEFNRAFEQLSGMTRDEVIGQSLTILFTDKTRENSMNLIRRALRGELLEIVEIPILSKSGETRIVQWNSANILDPAGKIIATIAQGQDITERKATDETIKRFGEILEREIAERTSGLTDISLSLMTEIDIRLDAEKQLTKSVGEKEVLLREVHHRVKNNLQIIISLVNLQMRKIDDPVLKQIMTETQNRVRAMSLVHEKLYRSESLSRIDFADYCRFLATQLMSYYSTDTRRVRLDFTLGKIMVDINTAVPLGLVMNELVSNALKHAFPDGRNGTISLSGGVEGDVITLVVRDNGVGMPADLDWKNTDTLGMRLITTLVDQVDGNIVLDQENGTAFTIVVKEKE
ncbi:MAG: PAS domain S-box protein [Methanoregula sp.]|nr:PAS domain S-box protein [Methanoregula sp.]